MTANLNINGNESQQPVKKPWKLGTYEKTQVGAFITPSKTSSINDLFTALPYANEALGVKAEKGNFFASAEIGAGTSATAKIETGYEIPIGKHFGLELSADARAAQSLIAKKFYKEINAQTDIQAQIVLDDPEGNGLLTVHDCCQVNHNIEAQYKEGNLAAGANIMAKYHPIDNLSYGIGVRAAVVSGNAANVDIKHNLASIVQYEDGILNSSHYNDLIVTIGEKHTQFVVSPVAEVKAEIGSKKGWEIGTRFSFDEVKVSGAYKF